MRISGLLTRSLVMAVVVAGAVVCSPSAALADKLHHADGRVLEGTVVRETDTFIQFKTKIGGIETVQTFLKTDVKKVERDAPPAAPAGATDPKPPTGDNTSGAAPAAAGTEVKPDGVSKDAESKRAAKAAETAKTIDSGANRVCILNFGAPSGTPNRPGDTVGIQVNAAAWRHVVPMLEKDKVDVVVVRINSGGGLVLEQSVFQSLFQNVYKRKFRTVGWVESAISCAAMSPYVLDEFYFLPNGNLGACTMWSGDLQSSGGWDLEEVMAAMEDASALAGRSPAIMRAMQIQVPLSCTIDERTGDVTWFQDTSGEHLVNKSNEILTLTANDAVKYKFARGVAGTKEELVKVMGLNEVVWAGEDATRYIDENMKIVDSAEKRWQDKYREVVLYWGYAEQSQDRTDRGKFVGKALAALREMRAMLSTNPNFPMLVGINNEWFRQTEDDLKRLLRDDR